VVSLAIDKPVETPTRKT